MNATSTSLRLLIVDDDEEFREATARLLESHPEVEVAGVCASGEECLAILGREPVPVVLLDYSMPGMDGTSTAQQIHERFPSTQVIMLTGFDFPESLDRSLLVGVQGFLTKDQTIVEIVAAAQSAARGERVWGPTAVESFAESRRREVQRRSEYARFYEVKAGLTHHLALVLDRLLEGLSNQKISRQLNLTEGSVRTYVSKILSLFECESRTALVVLAARAGYEPGGDINIPRSSPAASSLES